MAVVGLHTLQKDLSVINRSLYYMCGFAVPAFFMASGYILLNRSTANIHYGSNKIKKILKVVFFWSLLITAAHILVYAARGQLSLQFLLRLPKIFIGSLIQRGELWQLWFLGALIILYAIYHVLMRHKNRLKYIWLLSFVIGLAIQTISYFIGHPLQSHIIQTFRIWTWIQYFVLGGLIGSHNREWETTMGRKAIVFILLTMLIVVYQNIIGKTFLHNTYAEYFYDSSLTVAWLVSMFDLLLNVKLNLPIKNMIQHISPLTMGIYIVHPLVIRMIRHFVVTNTIGMTFLFFFAVLILSTICTWVIVKIPFAKQMVEL